MVHFANSSHAYGYASGDDSLRKGVVWDLLILRKSTLLPDRSLALSSACLLYTS